MMTSLKEFVVECKQLHLRGLLDGEPISPSELTKRSAKVLASFTKKEYRTPSYEGNPVHFMLVHRDELSQERSCRTCTDGVKGPKFGEKGCDCRKAVEAFLAHHRLDLVQVTQKAGWKPLLMAVKAALRNNDSSEKGKARYLSAITHIQGLYAQFLIAIQTTQPKLSKHQGRTLAVDQLKQAMLQACARGGWRCRLGANGLEFDKKELNQDNLERLPIELLRLAETVAMSQSDVKFTDRAVSFMKNLTPGGKEGGMFQSAWERVTAFPVRATIVAPFAWCKRTAVSTYNSIRSWFRKEDSPSDKEADTNQAGLLRTLWRLFLAGALLVGTYLLVGLGFLFVLAGTLFAASWACVMLFYVGPIMITSALYEGSWDLAVVYAIMAGMNVYLGVTPAWITIVVICNLVVLAYHMAMDIAAIDDMELSLA